MSEKHEKLPIDFTNEELLKICGVDNGWAADELRNRMSEQQLKATGHPIKLSNMCQRQIPREDITYTYESDGDKSRPTYYIVAQHDSWQDPKRLDFTDSKTAKDACRRLRIGEIDMSQAEVIAGRKWL